MRHVLHSVAGDAEGMVFEGHIQNIVQRLKNFVQPAKSNPPTSDAV
jgi:hypothetical protein